jgi:hypothetical protein
LFTQEAAEVAQGSVVAVWLHRESFGKAFHSGSNPHKRSSLGSSKLFAVGSETTLKQCQEFQAIF